MLRGHQRHTRIHEFLLRVEHVERGSLSGPRLIAIDINIEALLAKCFLVLANGGIFSAALIKRDRELAQNGDIGRPKFLRYRLVTLRIGSSEPKIRIKRGLADFHRE